jgi:glycosyltransferase involved in cell wall biosynthesis
VNFSVLILTRDEEKNIQACIDTLRFCDDIVVLDSLSRDRTKDIAQSAGCRVFDREFDDFAGQRNWAMDNIDFKHDWVFHLDADERFTSELAGECEDVVHEDLYSGYMIAGKLMFMGRWLRHSGSFPVFQMRFAKLGEIRFRQSGHGQREAGAVRGVGYLKYSYLHFPFKKGVGDWYQKHLGYADAEAKQSFEEAGLAEVDSRGLLASDPAF